MTHFDHWGTEVQVLHTHISTVVLAGDLAYKFKKPVKLPFLDFSTLEARRHYCDEELRLNRRTAPDLYLDVLPVSTRADGGLVLGATANAPVTDWVLRMRRFPAEAVWSHMAANGQLNDARVDALAAHVAAFHTAQEPMPPNWAPAKDVDAWTEDSLDAIARHPGRPAWLSLERQTRLREQIGHRLAELEPWRHKRQAQGWVRECHGDLHLANLVEWQGRQVAFDAIEFEPDLRCIDVMNDAAFAFMDLLAHGLPALAWRFVNAYVEHTGDFDGLTGLHAFATYRALVRANVALLSNAPPEVFERYWLLAEHLAALPRTPAVLVTMGLSGSGKSTLAQELVALLALQGVGAVRVRSDVERKRLCGLPATARPGPDIYSPEATRQTYARLAEVARVLVAAGLVAVVDAAFLRQAERDAMRELAQQAGAHFALLECVASQERMQARLITRQAEGRDASDATPQVLALQMAFAEPIPPDWAALHVRVTNDATLEDLQTQAHAWADTFSSTR